MPRSLRLRAASAVSSTHSTEGGRTIGRFHIRGTAKRRGGNLPARLRFSAHRGVTLIELMISMLILTLVCVAWLEIIGIQSARKEARRREAVERLAGMMDAFMDYYKTGIDSDGNYIEVSRYRLQLDGSSRTLCFKPVYDATEVYPIPTLSRGDSTIGYQLRVVDGSNEHVRTMSAGWGSNHWLVGLLYDRTGSEGDAGRPFFILPVCLGFDVDLI